MANHFEPSVPQDKKHYNENKLFTTKPGCFITVERILASGLSV
jgi:hypothetical protein